MTNGPVDPVDLSALSGLAPELAQAFVRVAGDIALVIDASGVIRDVAVGDTPFGPGPAGWVGHRWTETVTGETRRKIELLLEEVGTTGVAKRREVNHPSPLGQDIPVAYAAIRLGQGGPVLAVGRDLRAIAAIQQRFVDAQQEMERDYWKKRQAEARYRMLFQVATDAVLVVDAQTMRIVEANRAAAELFGSPPEQIVGQPANAGIDAASRSAVDELLGMARSTGRAGEIRVRARAVAGRGVVAIDLAATPFRASWPSESSLLLLVRARVAEVAAPRDDAGALAERLAASADAVVITDASGRILMANPGFLELFEFDAEADCKGRAIGDAIGDARAGAILGTVRRAGIAAPAEAAVRTSRRGTFGVEVSAALLAEGDQECIGFTIRRLPARKAGKDGDGNGPAAPLAAALQHLASRLGYLPLADLLPEAAELVERHLIDTALARAVGDRVLGAEILGLSVDALAERMRRLGMVADEARGRTGHGTPPTLLN